MKLFPLLDDALIREETKSAVASRTPSVWPSEASVNLIEDSASPVKGKCHRASYFRMTGVPKMVPTKPEMGWRWVTGRDIEDHVVTLARKAGVFAAAGVKTLIKDIYVPLEVDLVTISPTEDNKGYINECKTFYGYSAKKDIVTLRKPKYENLMQVLMYLNEIGTGANMKRLIAEGLENKELRPGMRNRIEADLEKVASMNDGPLGAKLLYISRDDCVRVEMDIGIYKEFDGSRYPMIDGQVYKIFTIDNIYERYQILQGYWFRARQEGVQRLQKRGINSPSSLKLILQPTDIMEDREYTKEETEENTIYLDLLAEEVKRLPVTFWPPAEFEFSYPDWKIEEMFSKGFVGKTIYKTYKSKKTLIKPIIGDFACSFCDYLPLCLPTQKNGAHLVHLIQDIKYNGVRRGIMITRSAILKIGSEKELFEQFEEFESELETILSPLKDKLATNVLGMSTSQLLGHMQFVESWRDRVSRYFSLTTTFIEHCKSSALFLEAGEKKISAVERDGYRRKLSAGFTGYNVDLEYLVDSIDSRTNLCKRVLDWEFKSNPQNGRF